MPSASAVERAIECEASAVLEAVHTTSAAADRGTWLHAYVTSNGGADVPLIYRDECKTIDLETMRKLFAGGDLIPEAALAWDAKSAKGRYLGSNIGRQYGDLGDHEIAGSADMLAKFDDHLGILDIKTGRSRVTPAAENWQLRTLAVMARDAFGIDSATVALGYLHRDGSWDVERAHLDAIDLDDYADQLRGMTERVHAAYDAVDRGDRPAANPSPSRCKWCPCRAACNEAA